MYIDRKVTKVDDKVTIFIYKKKIVIKKKY